ncbi:MAG: sulfate transporter, partial [Pirellulaceae bacterium]|nr:sulfate transporter [Pirellulaceae bacterium]
RQLRATSRGPHPLAIVLSCIDSSTPAEMIFDLGLGDIFSVRIAGNVISPMVLGSIEYGCTVAGAKLVIVVGHTCCGAVAAAVDLACTRENPEQQTGCQNLEPIVRNIQEAFDGAECRRLPNITPEEKAEFIDGVAERNVQRSVDQIVEQSSTLSRLVREGRIAVVGAMFEVSTGTVRLLGDRPVGVAESEEAAKIPA